MLSAHERSSTICPSSHRSSTGLNERGCLLQLGAHKDYGANTATTTTAAAAVAPATTALVRAKEVGGEGLRA